MNDLRHFFSFNKSQERGIFVLSVILILVILTNYFALDRFTDDKADRSDNLEYLKKIKLRSIEEKTITKKKYTKKYIQETPLLIVPRAFNPNKITVDELKKMGLPDRVANNIEKYRNCGGVFHQPKDLKKIYGLSEEAYASLKDYIVIPDERKKTKRSKSSINKFRNDTIKTVVLKKEVRDSIYLGINTADSVELLQINGIGPFYAGAIIKYRHQLGGYIDIHQLFDLYKMDSLKFERISRYLFVDTVSLVKININKADFKTILSHPYIDYETTKYIVNKRRQLGQYAALYELKDPKEVPDNIYNKILPYLTLD